MTTKPDLDTDVLRVRIVRVMNESDTSRRRCMFITPEGAKWMTLSAEDVRLLIGVGYDKILFQKAEHVFNSENQPLVEIIEFNKGAYRVHAAYSKSKKRFISHSEKEEKVADKSVEKVKAKTPAEIMERVYANVEEIAGRDRAERAKSREESGTITTPEDLLRQEAEILKGVVIKVDSAQESYGKIQLGAMWKLRNEGLFSALGDGFTGVSDVFRNEDNLYQRDYTIALAYIVDRIFVPVAALEKAGKPFTHPDTGEPITVDYLIATNGLVQKMKIASSVFARLPDLKDRRKLLGLIVSKNVKQLAAETSEMSKFLLGDGGVASGSNDNGDVKTSDLIPVKIESIPNSQKSRLILEVTSAQQAAVIRLLQSLLGEISQ